MLYACIQYIFNRLNPLLIYQSLFINLFCPLQCLLIWLLVLFLKFYCFKLIWYILQFVCLFVYWRNNPWFYDPRITLKSRRVFKGHSLSKSECCQHYPKIISPKNSSDRLKFRWKVKVTTSKNQQTGHSLENLLKNLAHICASKRGHWFAYVHV